MQPVKPGKVIVNLISSDGSKEVFTRCLPSITVSDLKAKWRQEHGPRLEDILLKTVDGAFPADDLPLNRFQDCSNPSQVIELTIVVGQGVLVLHNQDSHKLPASVISKTPRQITLQIRNLFRFPSKQVFRLLSGDRVLANDLSLNDQGVGPGCQLFVDKQIVLAVKDLSNDGQELQLEAFESQTLSEVMPQPWQEFLEKLMFLSEYGDRITPDTSIKNFLEHNPQLKLQVDRIDEIHFLIDHQLSSPSLSSTDQPRTVLPYRIGPREVMVGEDRRLIPTASPLGRLRKHRVDGNAVLHVDPLRVLYREGEKKTARFKVMRFPRGSLSEDFRQNHIASGRTEARLETLVDGEGKDLEAKEGPLAALKDGARVQLKPSQPKHHSIRVVTGNRTLEWTEHRPVINFSELSGQVALMSEASPLEVMCRAFRCVGCSRKICLEEEEFQLIPAPCCRERSLVLREVKGEARSSLGCSVLSPCR